MKMGKETQLDETGRDVLEMDVDEDSYPLDPITDYDKYMTLKPPKRPEIVDAAAEELSTSLATSAVKGKAYAKYGDREKERFFFLVY
jgi:hypothetical protein